MEWKRIHEGYYKSGSYAIFFEINGEWIVFRDQERIGACRGLSIAKRLAYLNREKGKNGERST